MSEKKLRVYGWQSMRRECPGPHRQTREIAAAASKAEIARLVGVARPSQLFNLSETWNKVEVELAMAAPRTIFWAPINSASKGDYRRAE